jgi:hypothetical protein
VLDLGDGQLERRRKCCLWHHKIRQHQACPCLCRLAHMRRPSSGSCGIARARPISLVLGVRSRGHSHTCLWWRVGFCLWLSLGGDTSVLSAKSQHLGSRCMHPLALYSSGTRALNDVRSNWVRHRHFSNLGVLFLLEASWITPITMGLTSHSSRTRFAGRLDSGVSRHKP